MTVYAGNVS